SVTSQNHSSRQQQFSDQQAQKSEHQKCPQLRGGFVSVHAFLQFPGGFCKSHSVICRQSGSIIPHQRLELIF
ncbi:MAG: hypothetical protein ACK56I_15680, partial [bacterium]